MDSLQKWLDDVMARLDAVKREPVQEERDYEQESAAWSDLYQHAPDDLARSVGIISRIARAVAQHPDPCEKYDDDYEVDDIPISCGWKMAFKDVAYSLKDESEIKLAKDSET